MLVHDYRIVRNFRGRKISQIDEKYEFCGKTFHRLLTFAASKNAMLKISLPQNRESHESFLPRKLSTIRYVSHTSPTENKHFDIGSGALTHLAMI